MDVTGLEAAHAEFLCGVGSATAASVSGAQRWPLDVVVAHVTLTTELLVKTTEHVLLGRDTWYDAAPASMRAYLDEVASIGLEQLVDRFRFASESLVHVASKLGEQQARRPVPVRVIEGSLVVIDQVPLAWRQALLWHERHLPMHAQDLHGQRAC